MNYITSVTIFTVFFSIISSLYSAKSDIVCKIDGYPLTKNENYELSCGDDMTKCCIAKRGTSSDLANPENYQVGERINLFFFDNVSDPTKGNGLIGAIVTAEFNLDQVGLDVINFIVEDGSTVKFTDFENWKLADEISN